MTETGGPEHDFEPIPGLPGTLPDGERLVWQGAPSWRLVMRHALKARWIVGYFAAIAAWVAWTSFETGRTMFDALVGLGSVAALAAVVLLLMAAFAKGVERTTLYTITNARVVIRVGVALSTTYNLPFKLVENVDLRTNSAGRGDIALRLTPSGFRLAWMMLWPHARGWRFKNVEPQLIGLEDGAEVGRILSDQLLAYLARHHAVDAQSSEQNNEPASGFGAVVAARSPAAGFSETNIQPAE